MDNIQFTKIKKNLTKATSKAISNFNMINDGDKIMVCMSGGKDSYTLLDMLLHIQKVAPINFSLIAVNLDQKQPGFPQEVLPNYLNSIKVDYKIIEQNTHAVVVEKIPQGKTMCSLCSRLRRGVLYKTAKNLNCNKIALGHHLNDAMETLFLNLFFGGKIESMPAKYLTDDKELIVLRPLIFCEEKVIATYAKHKNFPIIPCNLCGSQDGLQRQVIKKMLSEWENEYPDRIKSITKAMSNVSSSHLLDEKLFNFSTLENKQL